MRWVILAGLILLAGCQPALQESAIRVRVVAVVDGDTLDAQTQEGDRVRVRLLGIDAPRRRSVTLWGSVALRRPGRR